MKRELSWEGMDGGLAIRYDIVKKSEGYSLVPSTSS